MIWRTLNTNSLNEKVIIPFGYKNLNFEVHDFELLNPKKALPMLYMINFVLSSGKNLN